MGMLARAGACALLLSVSAHAGAAGRIAYPSIYALMAVDVTIVCASAPREAPLVSPLWHPYPCGQRPGVETVPPLRFTFTATRLAAAVSARRPARWMPEIATADLLPDYNSAGDIHDIIQPDTRQFAPTPFEGMVSFSIGGDGGDRGSLSLQRGLAGALWRASHP